VAQVFEQVLAVLAVADVVFAEDQVVAGVTQLAHGDPAVTANWTLVMPAMLSMLRSWVRMLGLASTMRAETVPSSITVGGAVARD
jgi:hypothetical protein